MCIARLKGKRRARDLKSFCQLDQAEHWKNSQNLLGQSVHTSLSHSFEFHLSAHEKQPWFGFSSALSIANAQTHLHQLPCHLKWIQAKTKDLEICPSAKALRWHLKRWKLFSPVWSWVHDWQPYSAAKEVGLWCVVVCQPPLLQRQHFHSRIVDMKCQWVHIIVCDEWHNVVQVRCITNTWACWVPFSFCWRQTDALLWAWRAENHKPIECVNCSWSWFHAACTCPVTVCEDLQVVSAALTIHSKHCFHETLPFSHLFTFKAKVSLQRKYPISLPKFNHAFQVGSLRLDAKVFVAYCMSKRSCAM